MTRIYVNITKTRPRQDSRSKMLIDGFAQNIETWIWRKTLKSLLRLTLISKTVWQPWKFGSSGLRNLSPDMRVQAYKTFWISEFSRNFHNKEEISSWVEEFNFPLMSVTQISEHLVQGQQYHICHRSLVCSTRGCLFISLYICRGNNSAWASSFSYQAGNF